MGLSLLIYVHFSGTQLQCLSVPIFLFLPLKRKLSECRSEWIKKVNLKILLLTNKCKTFDVKEKKSVTWNILHLLVNKRRMYNNTWYTQFQNLKISHSSIYNSLGPHVFLSTSFLIYLCLPQYQSDFSVQTNCKCYCIQIVIFSSFKSGWFDNLNVFHFMFFMFVATCLKRVYIATKWHHLVLCCDHIFALEYIVFF